MKSKKFTFTQTYRGNFCTNAFQEIYNSEKLRASIEVQCKKNLDDEINCKVLSTHTFVINRKDSPQKPNCLFKLRGFNNFGVGHCFDDLWNEEGNNSKSSKCYDFYLSCQPMKNYEGVLPPLECLIKEIISKEHVDLVYLAGEDHY